MFSYLIFKHGLLGELYLLTHNRIRADYQAGKITIYSWQFHYSLSDPFYFVAVTIETGKTELKGDDGECWLYCLVTNDEEANKLYQFNRVMMMTFLVYMSMEVTDHRYIILNFNIGGITPYLC